jgi:prepilin-type N-terminal cleavage/methylation domain-containing protein
VRTRNGFSLLEVLVVLVLIGLIATVSGLAMRSNDDAEPGWRDQLLAARRRAASTGTMVNGFADSTGAFTAHPTGLVLTDSGSRISFALEAHAR